MERSTESRRRKESAGFGREDPGRSTCQTISKSLSSYHKCWCFHSWSLDVSTFLQIHFILESVFVSWGRTATSGCCVELEVQWRFLFARSCSMKIYGSARTPWHSWRRWEKPTISFKSRTDMDASIDCNETVKGRSENRKIGKSGNSPHSRSIHQNIITSVTFHHIGFPRWFWCFRPHRASKLWLTRTRSDFVSVWCGPQKGFLSKEISLRSSLNPQKHPHHHIIRNCYQA